MIGALSSSGLIPPPEAPGPDPVVAAVDYSYL